MRTRRAPYALAQRRFACWPSTGLRPRRPDPSERGAPHHRPPSIDHARALAALVRPLLCQPSWIAIAMTYFRNFLRTGHAPTLFAAFLYFAFSCCTWVLNGAMAPFISDTFPLSPAQKGLMLSVPIIAGALFRFPLGVLSQYIGRKRATLVEIGRAHV